jgi:glycerol-3-phosphate dehydrogenase (NAD(P)+)
MNVTIAGAGAWGTALAVHAAQHANANGQHICLWARDAQLVANMQRDRRNERYLPGVDLPANLRLTASWDEALQHSQVSSRGLLIVAAPMAALADMLQRTPSPVPVMWLCKGFEKNTGRLGHEIADALRPQAANGVLSGPSFAQEVAQSRPTALVAASSDPDLAQLAVAVFHTDSLRVYTSTDPIGVEVGGAVKNVMAIATGVADGLALGLNARAALITRGLAEMTRLGVALGGQAETFMGLSGLGDLVLTATGDLSRNRQVGLQLAKGLSLPDILQKLGHVSEGVYSASTVLARAQALQVDMPITQAVVDLLEDRISATEAVRQLMHRDATSEF